MQFFAQYWWLLLLPMVLVLWIWSLRRTPRSQWVWLLVFFGIALPFGAVTWLFTGDIDTPYVSIKFGGVGEAIASIGLGPRCPGGRLAPLDFPAAACLTSA